MREREMSPRTSERGESDPSDGTEGERWGGLGYKQVYEVECRLQSR